jgi:hypothetical protein
VRTFPGHALDRQFAKAAAVKDQRVHRGLEVEGFDPEQHQLVISRRNLFDNGAVERHRRSLQQHGAIAGREPFEPFEAIA